MIKNIDIRKDAKANDVKLWEIAENYTPKTRANHNRRTVLVSAKLMKSRRQFLEGGIVRNIFELMHLIHLLNCLLPCIRYGD